MASDAGSTWSGLGRALSTYTAAAVTTAAGWWALLGWDTQKTVGSDGYLHGPYEPWQVIGLLVVLGLLAAWLGHRRSLLAGPAVAAVALAICFGISGELDQESDGLWMIGAILTLIGSFAGIAAVAVATRFIGQRAAAPRWQGRPSDT